jgi:ATP-dependent Clp protease ATP-binding subunit ClpC
VQTANAAMVLSDLGLDLRTIRIAVERIVGPGGIEMTRGRLPFNEEAKKALQFGAERSRERACECMDTEHILAGVLCDGTGVAARVLTSLGANVQELYGALAHRRQRP